MSILPVGYRAARHVSWPDPRTTVLRRDTMPVSLRGDNHPSWASRSRWSHRQASGVTDPDAATEPRWMLPRGLIVLLGMTGLLVTILALQQFAAILAPVLLALVLVIGFHPLIGILRRRGAPTWLAVTTTVLTLSSWSSSASPPPSPCP